MNIQSVITNDPIMEKSLDKVRNWTCQLLNVLDMQFTRMFRQPNCPYADDNKVRRLTSLVSNAEALCRSLQSTSVMGDSSNKLRQIEENLREILVILFQMVTQKSAPTDIIYFKMFSIDINNSTLLDPFAIEFLKILFLLCIVGLLLAFMRTGNTQFSDTIEQLRKKTLVFKDTKTIINACVNLAKIDSLLLMTGKGNVDRILPSVMNELNNLFAQPTQGLNNANTQTLPEIA